MKEFLLLALATLLLAGCASRQDVSARPSQQTRTAAGRANLADIVNVSDVRQEPGEEATKVPPEWQEVDFRNHSYPVSWGRRAFKLEGGEYEYYQDKGFKDSSGWFRLLDVHYADVTGDARPEAIVRVSQVNCGGSCDGGADLIYFYTAGGRRPRLLWRLETGSLGYGCGLKSFKVRGDAATIETFKNCRLDRESLVGDDEREPGEPAFKFSAKTFTRFRFEFDGRRFTLTKREVFPNPRQDVKNYSASVSISDE